MSFKNLYKASPPELKQIVMDQWKAKQNPQHHPEGNTLKHIIVVTDRAFRDFPDNKDIQLAAYFHDLGKLATYAINPKNGQPTAYGHEEESTQLIDQFREFVQQQGANPEIVKYIVKNHMKIKPSTWDVMKPSKKDPIINDPHYKDLEKFGTIDKGGLLEFKYLYKSNKRMKTQINEIKRMQQLAGILKEAEDNTPDGDNISNEIQALINKNDYLKGKVTAKPADIIEGNNFVLLFSEDAAKHIAERHLDGTKPGSLFKSGVNLRDVAKKLLNIEPSEEAGGRVKWLGANGGNIGEMGVAKASPEEVAKMKDYTMPDGQKEQVKIAPGKRKPTSEVSLITAELGTLGNGKKALSLITMFPGGTKIDGTEIPMNRGEFASKGFYFVVDPSSPLLKESLNKSKLFEVLDDLTDAQSASTFIKDQLSTYIDNNLSDYGAGYQLEEKLDKLLNLVSKKFNIPGNSFKVEDKYSTSYNEYDEATVKGEIKINGQVVIDYSSHGDGYGFSADIDENALKAQLEKLMKPTNEVFDKLDEIVDRVLLKVRKQLNENLIQSDFEEIIDNIIDKAIEDDFYGSGPSDEDEEEQLRNIVVSRAQEELKTKYPGIEVGVQLTNKGNQYYTVEDEEKNIPYLTYTRS